jgi:hypothetical protein
MPNNMLFFNGKKFMWDGIDYPSGEQASETMNKYKTDGFEVELHEEDGKTYLYTRRVVKEVIVQAA